MERVYNFSAGPSMLPLPVLEKVQKGNVKLWRFWYVRNGDESPFQVV